MSGHPESSESDRRQRETMLTVTMIVLVGGGFFLFLDAVAFGFFGAALLFCIGLALIGGLQYFLWGKRLDREVEKEREMLSREEVGQPPENHPWERRF